MIKNTIKVIVLSSVMVSSSFAVETPELLGIHFGLGSDIYKDLGVNKNKLASSCANYGEDSNFDYLVSNHILGSYLNSNYDHSGSLSKKQQKVAYQVNKNPIRSSNVDVVNDALQKHLKNQSNTAPNINVGYLCGSGMVTSINYSVYLGESPLSDKEYFDYLEKVRTKLGAEIPIKYGTKAKGKVNDDYGILVESYNQGSVFRVIIDINYQSEKKIYAENIKKTSPKTWKSLFEEEGKSSNTLAL